MYLCCNYDVGVKFSFVKPHVFIVPICFVCVPRNSNCFVFLGVVCGNVSSVACSLLCCAVVVNAPLLVFMIILCLVLR